MYRHLRRQNLQKKPSTLRPTIHLLNITEDDTLVNSADLKSTPPVNVSSFTSISKDDAKEQDNIIVKIWLINRELNIR